MSGGYWTLCQQRADAGHTTVGRSWSRYRGWTAEENKIINESCFIVQKIRKEFMGKMIFPDFFQISACAVCHLYQPVILY